VVPTPGANHPDLRTTVGQCSGLVERGIERGELPAGSDPTLIIETTVGPLWLRLLLTGEPLDRSFAARVADLVAAGAATTDRG
jgi:hypothetical protein